ncbi:uncharacterized protein LOC124688103 [Lolium rigidum]|uniref:uncharacterized protein LOC124688103 n=1 Tax=Lolium rigidum TaxID=89674 RepID=UPI001F5C8D60|nr:uncharacterized protein LOC124688103 [Lolium rigidum]
MAEGFNKKRAVLTLSQEPEVGAMAAAPVGTVHWSKWSSLPGDLVRRIADSFLASNDLDHYMCFRAICTCWRSATDEPKDNVSDPRFQPRRWIVLDEVFQTEGKLLLLNTDTGRFLHKKLPLLREYYVVATTPSGFFILADRSPPHAARVFNPLTGDLTRFVAPMPPEVGVAEVSCDKGALYLHFLGDSTCKIYMALLGNQGFVSTDCGKKVYNIFRDAILGGAYPQRISGPALVAAFGELCDYVSSPHGDPLKVFSDLPEEAANNIRFRFFVVGLDAQLFLHIEIQGRTPFVFKMNNEIGKIEPVESVGRFAIFIGHHGCLAVDADKFPGMEANCIYYTQDLGSSAHICKYNIKDKKVERLSEVAEFMKQDKQFVLVTARPSTIIQLLCSYTIKCRYSELVWQQTL